MLRKTGSKENTKAVRCKLISHLSTIAFKYELNVKSGFLKKKINSIINFFSFFCFHLKMKQQQKFYFFFSSILSLLIRVWIMTCSWVVKKCQSLSCCAMTFLIGLAYFNWSLLSLRLILSLSSIIGSHVNENITIFYITHCYNERFVWCKWVVS